MSAKQPLQKMRVGSALVSLFDPSLVEEYEALPKKQRGEVQLAIANIFGIDFRTRSEKRSYMRDMECYTWREDWNVKDFMGSKDNTDFSPEEYQREYEAHIFNPQFVIDIIKALCDNTLKIQPLHIRILDENISRTKWEQNIFREVLDGCQRSNSIIVFWFGKLTRPLPENVVVDVEGYGTISLGGVMSLSELTNPNSKWYKNHPKGLGKLIRKQLEESDISVQLYEGLTDDKAAKLFRVLNNANTLSEQQIRNSYRGAMRKFVARLARGYKGPAEETQPPHPLFTLDGVDKFVTSKQSPKYVSEKNSKMAIDQLVAKFVNWIGRKDDEFKLTQGTTKESLLHNYQDKNWRGEDAFKTIKEHTEKVLDTLHESFTLADSKGLLKFHGTENAAFKHKYMCVAVAVTHSLLYDESHGKREMNLKDKSKLVVGIKKYLDDHCIVKESQWVTLENGTRIVAVKAGSDTEFGKQVRNLNTMVDWQQVHDAVWNDMKTNPENYGISLRTKKSGFNSKYIEQAALAQGQRCAICDNREYDGRPLSFKIKYPDGEAIVGGHNKGRSKLGKGGSLEPKNCDAMHNSCNQWQGENDTSTARVLYAQLIALDEYIVSPLEKKVA